MIGAAKAFLLYVLRIPSEPSSPSGSEQSLVIFRASSNYFRYRLVLWGLAQAASLAGLIIFDGIVIGQIRDSLPDWVANGLWFFIGFAVLAWLVGFVITGLMVTLDYEMRWYLVTDQSLRIREGLWNVREMTMTFANIQNISIEQGPLQRFLGIADLKVKSAGGGGGSHGSGDGDMESGLDLHVGFFRGVDNAEELRDLMREYQRRSRGSSGLGDPEDAVLEAPVSSSSELADVLADLRGQAQALSAAARSLG